MVFCAEFSNQIHLLTSQSFYQQISEVKRVLNEDETDLIESRFKLPEPPKRQQQAIRQGADEAKEEISSRIEEVNPKLKCMGKIHEDQPIEVRYINKVFKYRKANEMGMVGA
jgi:alpha-D-ribose 1-methylphosphonate 5-phosphate C-P lyase